LLPSLRASERNLEFPQSPVNVKDYREDDKANRILTAIAFLSALVAVAFATILQHIHLPHYLVRSSTGIGGCYSRRDFGGLRKRSLKCKIVVNQTLLADGDPRVRSTCSAELVLEGEDQMMLDWNVYRQQLIDTIGRIARLSPDTVRGCSSLSAAGSKTNHLDPKTRELIALAVAVTLRCDGCITVHTDAAIKQGASKEEIAEVLGVAVSINAGAALVYSARVMDAYEVNAGSSAVGTK
jgi:AhpD family alkylhydroperoxidase